MVEWSLVLHRVAALACAAYGLWLLPSPFDAWNIDSAARSILCCVLLYVLAPRLAHLGERHARGYAVFVFMTLVLAYAADRAAGALEESGSLAMALATPMLAMSTLYMGLAAATTLLGASARQTTGILALFMLVAHGAYVYYFYR